MCTSTVRGHLPGSSMLMAAGAMLLRGLPRRGAAACRHPHLIGQHRSQLDLMELCSEWHARTTMVAAHMMHTCFESVHAEDRTDRHLLFCSRSFAESSRPTAKVLYSTHANLDCIPGMRQGRSGFRHDVERHQGSLPGTTSETEDGGWYLDESIHQNYIPSSSQHHTLRARAGARAGSMGRKIQKELVQRRDAYITLGGVGMEAVAVAVRAVAIASGDVCRENGLMVVSQLLSTSWEALDKEGNVTRLALAVHAIHMCDMQSAALEKLAAQRPTVVWKETDRSKAKRWIQAQLLNRGGVNIIANGGWALTKTLGVAVQVRRHLQHMELDFAMKIDCGQVSGQDLPSDRNAESIVHGAINSPLDKSNASIHPQTGAREAVPSHGDAAGSGHRVFRLLFVRCKPKDPKSLILGPVDRLHFDRLRRERKPQRMSMAARSSNNIFKSSW